MADVVVEYDVAATGFFGRDRLTVDPGLRAPS